KEDISSSSRHYICLNSHLLCKKDNGTLNRINFLLQCIKK
ncbi:hypothetical protein EAG_14795, partial [Camponotus floridanus]